MSRNSQQRRAKNKRRLAHEQRQAPTTSTTSGTNARPPRLDDEAIRAQILRAAHNIEPGRSKSSLSGFTDHLLGEDLDGSLGRRVLALSSPLLVAGLARMFDNGWQPADVAHVVKRDYTLQTQRLAIALIAAHARVNGAVDRAPLAWLSQLEDLGAFDADAGTIIGGHAEAVATWARTERLHPDEALAIAMQMLATTLRAVRLSRLVDPPSAWGTTNRGAFAARTVSLADVDAKALKTIRALLAKAEGTTFDAEAEAFTAKAQELMTRHSIDAAVLAAAARHDGGQRLAAGVESLRVHIDSPYADEKAAFLSVIADVNSARSIWSPDVGFSTVMGFPVDLRLTDLLFTSLLVQATRASAEATSRDRELSTASFRRAFLVAFAQRVGERLRATQRSAAAEAEQFYGSALVPILADREAAVEEAYSTAFPNTRPMTRRSYDAAGWYAGQAAADRADIGAGAAIANT